MNFREMHFRQILNYDFGEILNPGFLLFVHNGFTNEQLSQQWRELEARTLLFVYKG